MTETIECANDVSDASSPPRWRPRNTAAMRVASSSKPAPRAKFVPAVIRPATFHPSQKLKLVGMMGP